ncbi:MAG: DUF6151 family protein [Pseudomonadota bacterium]
MDHATWTCDCGAVAAEIPVSGNRLVCYCSSCRGFVEDLNKPERLDAAGGNDLFQVDPRHVRLFKGTEHLRWMKRSPKGPMRWYAACCNTPMANTLSKRALAFASFQVADITPAEKLPDVGARVHLKGALARVEEPLGSVRPMIFSLLGRTVAGLVTGGYRRNPFFDSSGTPIAPRSDPDPSPG